jgi:protein-S-isoprenylcysteine O-methyltransferase
MTERIDEAMRQRLVANNTSKRSSLEMNHSTAKGGYGGFFPNTPLAAATISFVLGSIFSLGFALFVSGGISESWWATWRLGYFVAAWSAFHYAEFAVTAGWNRDRCSVDCKWNNMIRYT